MYQFQLNFAMFCATSALGISWQYLNHPSLLVRSVYRFHLDFYVRIKMHLLGISLSQEDDFSRVKTLTLKVYTTVFVMTMALLEMKHGCMGIGFKRQRSPPANLIRLIIAQSKGFTTKANEKISRFVRA